MPKKTISTQSSIYRMESRSFFDIVFVKYHTDITNLRIAAHLESNVREATRFVYINKNTNHRIKEADQIQI